MGVRRVGTTSFPPWSTLMPMIDRTHLRRGAAPLPALAVAGVGLANPPAAPPPGPGTAQGGVESSGNPATRHPLDPLEPAEIERAVASVREARGPGKGLRFVSVSLDEPSKEVVRR